MDKTKLLQVCLVKPLVSHYLDKLKKMVVVEEHYLVRLKNKKIKKKNLIFLVINNKSHYLVEVLLDLDQNQWKEDSLEQVSQLKVQDYLVVNLQKEVVFLEVTKILEEAFLDKNQLKEAVYLDKLSLKAKLSLVEATQCSVEEAMVVKQASNNLQQSLARVDKPSEVTNQHSKTTMIATCTKTMKRRHLQFNFKQLRTRTIPSKK